MCGITILLVSELECLQKNPNNKKTVYFPLYRCAASFVLITYWNNATAYSATPLVQTAEAALRLLVKSTRIYGMMTAAKPSRLCRLRGNKM